MMGEMQKTKRPAKATVKNSDKDVTELVVQRPSGQVNEVQVESAGITISKSCQHTKEKVWNYTYSCKEHHDHPTYEWKTKT